jgi:hypothetical protein
MTRSQKHIRSLIRIGRPIEALRESPHFADLVGRDGLPCRVWKNPDRQEFATALRSPTADTSGLRGLLTRSDLYVWQSINLLHSDFERDTGIEGMRIALRANELQTSDESVALPAHFPWVFPDCAQAEAMDVEDRRKVAIEYLQANVGLKCIYPAGYTIVWYS